MFKRFFEETYESFQAFKTAWSFEVKPEERQAAVDDLMTECVPSAGEQVIYALVMLHLVDTSQVMLISLEKARYLRYFYDCSSCDQLRRAFRFLVHQRAFEITLTRPKSTNEHLSLGQENSSQSLRDRLFFLKNVLQANAQILTPTQVSTLQTLLSRYEESKLLSTCQLAEGEDKEISEAWRELQHVLQAYDQYAQRALTSPAQPQHKSVRSRISITNTVFPVTEQSIRRPLSVPAPQQRANRKTSLRATTPPLEQISNMPNLDFV